MVILKIQRGNIGAAQKFYQRLLEMRERMKENTLGRAMLENRIHCAALCLPAEPNSNLLLSLAILSNERSGSGFSPARLSATGKMPSVLRGAKDWSGFARHYSAAASIVRPTLDAFLEDGGAGVCEAGIAELFYEKNDLNEASLQAAAALSSQNPEIAFAALSLMARIGAVDTAAKPPADILAHIGQMLESKKAFWLVPNYRALCARFDILRGNADKIREWVDGCGLDDLGGYPLRDCYELLTLAKAYIALGEHRNAATLLEGLTLAMQKEGRTLDTIECLINGAIVCDMMGNGERAVQKLEQALASGREYGYIRVFADCGRRLFHLMARYVREQPPNGGRLGERYIQRITEAAGIFSTLYPALYSVPGESGAKEDEGEGGELTQGEIHVLQLLGEGKPNKDIAAELYLQPSTIKYHLQNIFLKLGASNRTQAVKRAREKGILE
jgi:LuxR family maltose regulon positive regulatory protein